MCKFRSSVFPFAVTIALAANIISLPAAADDITAPNGFWQGAYIGIHAGGGSGTIDGLGAVASVNASDTMNGFAGGILAGWNFEQGNWLYGLETDISLGAIEGNIAHLGAITGGTGGSLGSFRRVGYAASSTSTSPAFIGVNVHEKIRWSGSFRARIGYLANPDILAFVSGGLALANYNIKTDSSSAGNDNLTFVGWTIGGGFEARLTDNWMARLEYLYSDYGAKTMFNSVGGVDVSPTLHTVRVAIIKKF